MRDKTIIILFSAAALTLSIVHRGLVVAQTVQGPSVRINEFVASNRDGLADGDGNTPDWIELYNTQASPISIGGWYLTDKRDDPYKWPFPRGTVLPSNGYLVVFASAQPAKDHVDAKGYLHANFALDADGEYLALLDAGGRIVHEYAPEFPAQQSDISYGLWQGAPSYFAAPTPGRANEHPVPGFVEAAQHSHRNGFYDAPFDLWIFSNTPGTSIRYTLDGSEPTRTHGFLHDSTVPIPIATTAVVRSLAYKAGWIPADVTTHTYIFVDDVVGQGPHPYGWPSDWDFDTEVGGIVPADYEMDPRVVANAQPGYSVREALLDVPTVSITMLPDDFVGRDHGIYAHPRRRWERKCSIEYILPDGAEGFQHDCKIEIHGNSSRRPWRMQKHSFRLTFTSEYGPPRLRYPLFPDSPVEEFNQLVLRACFTDSWGLVTWMPSRYRPHDSQYLRDVWMKESLRDMGQPSSYGNFVHLYVNGLYFGLFNLTERIAEEFFAAHLGGRSAEWEINKDFSTPGPRWQAMMAVDPSTLAGYARMQEYLDIENFADYILLHLYADAEDWPHHNGYAAANVRSGDGRFRFFVWDQEIVLDQPGRAASRVNHGRGAGALLQTMRTSEEFRLLFADRAYRHCFDGGALSLVASQERYRDLALQIDKAIVAESARWGDTQMSTPYGNTIEQPNPPTDSHHILFPPAPHGPDYYFTRQDSWVIERDHIIESYIPAIHDRANTFALLNVLRRHGLYPAVDPPQFHLVDSDREDPSAAAHLMMTSGTAGEGTIYYTLDGTDPRMPGENLQDDVRVLVGEPAAKRVLIPTRDIRRTWVGARPYDDSEWTHGTGGVGYERGTGYESLFETDVEEAMYGVSAGCYLRTPFALASTELEDLGRLILRVRYDDGFVAYLNGVEVARDGFAGEPRWDSVADGSRPDSEAASLVDFNITEHVDRLRTGDNLLAIHGLNGSATSSDFLISVELIGAEWNPEALPYLSAGAFEYADPIPLTENIHIKARLWHRGQWSALNETTSDIPGF